MNLRHLSRALFAALCLALAVPSSMAVAQSVVRASGQILNSATSNAALTVSLFEGQSVLGVNIAGLTAAGATLTVEGSTDGKAAADSGKTWRAVGAVGLPGGSTTLNSALTADGGYRIDISGFDAIRFRVSSTGTGNITLGYIGIPGASLGNAVSPTNSSGAPLYVTPAAAANPWPVADSALLAAVNSSIPAGTNGIGTINSQYPTGAVPITASATGTTGATTATLTNVTAHTTYICGFSIRANATAAATGNATVTGTITGTLNFTQWTAPTASGLGVTEEIFTPCVPASAVSTSIAVVSAAPSTGGVVSVTAWGYSL